VWYGADMSVGSPRLVQAGVLVLLLSVAIPQIHAAEPRTSAQTFAGAREVQAIATAFPHRVEDVAVRDGEWALRVDDTWYYWAEGRLLPEPIRRRWDEYVAIRFYRYSLGPWTMPYVPPELESRFRDYTANRDNDTRVRFNTFLDSLYGVFSRAQANALMEPVSFFNMRTHVHPDVVEPLQRVEERIRVAMLDDQMTRAFIRDLAGIHGYNWRVIAGTLRRSYHSYGMAVDLVPRQYNGGWAYWRWAADSGVEAWWRITERDRWMVPQTIIDAFEAEGFVWGGKWMFFDNVHFEYRPEVILLARGRGAPGE
jgi:hypothetical protein